MYNIQLKHLYYINSQTKYLIKNRRHTDKQDVDLTRHRSIEMSNKDFLRNKIHWYGFRTQVGIPVGNSRLKILSGLSWSLHSHWHHQFRLLTPYPHLFKLPVFNHQYFFVNKYKFIFITKINTWQFRSDTHTACMSIRTKLSSTLFCKAPDIDIWRHVMFYLSWWFSASFRTDLLQILVYEYINR